MKIKLNIKNAVIKQTGDTVEITTSFKQIIDVEVTGTRSAKTEERRIYLQDREDKTKVWMV